MHLCLCMRGSMHGRACTHDGARSETCTYIPIYKKNDCDSYSCAGRGGVLFHFHSYHRNEIHAHSLRFRCVSARAKFRDQNEEDVDVARERRRVLSGSADSDVMRLENLTKV